MNKKNKKLILFLIIIVLVVCGVAVWLLLGLSKTEETLAHELDIYNWEHYISQDILDGFEKKYGVKVNLYEYYDASEMHKKIKENETKKKFDLLILSDAYLKKMLKENLFLKLNKKNIPNRGNLDPQFLNKHYDLKNKYSFPYLSGTTGLFVNTKYVPKNTDSWDVLWKLDYEDKIGFFKTPEDFFGPISKYIGSPIVPMTRRDIQTIENFINFHDMNWDFYGFVDIQEKIISEDIWLAIFMSGHAHEIVEKNPGIKYIIPKEGGAIWADNMVIPKGTKSKYTAEMFINYILDAGVGAKLAAKYNYMSPNLKSKRMLEQDSVYKEFANIDKNTMKRLEYYSDYDQPENIRKLQEDLWKDLTKDK